MKDKGTPVILKRMAGFILCMAMVVCSVLPSFALSFQTASNARKVRQVLNSMTLEQKVAQMILVSAPTATVRAKQPSYQFGGFLFFADFFENNTKSGVQNSMRTLKNASNVAPLIAVDEEGGTVNRVSKFKQYRSSPFQSPRNVYRNGWTAVTADTTEKARLLKSLGINTNLAPVVDVPYNSNNYMYSRAVSTDVNVVSTFAQKSVSSYNSAGVISCMKHFPGYGNNGNTHNAVIHDKRSKNTFETRDLLPFKSGIQAGAPMILVSHNVVECYDSKNPASLSSSVHKVLRNSLGFNGVVLTDDLGMAGVQKMVGNNAQIAVKAVRAGNDLLCTRTPVTSYNAILSAVKTGSISESRINESVTRILTMKANAGLL